MTGAEKAGAQDAAAHRPASVTASSGGSAPVVAAPSRRRWLFWVVVIVFAVIFAQDLFQAVTDAFGVPADIAALNALRAEAELPPIAVPWPPIIVNLVLPVVVFGAALATSWRRPVLVAVLVFAVGVAVVAALTLDMYLLAGLLVT